MKEKIQQRLKSLRQEMTQANIDAYIIPSSDPHLSEYPPECWKDRMWISGFTGSAGTVVVTADEAGLWTDSRYFLQGAAEIEGTGISLFREGLSDTPSITSFIRSKESIRRIGFNGKAISLSMGEEIRKTLSVAGIEVNAELDLVSKIRKEPAQIPMNPFFIQPLEYAGQSAADKIAAVRSRLKEAGANAYIITMLDELAWIFNLRGNDVDYNPVAIGYGLITPNEVCFYTFEQKVTSEVARHLDQAGVSIHHYDKIYSDVAALPTDTVLFVDPQRTNDALVAAVPDSVPIVRALSPLTLLKACKNEAEYRGYLSAMKRDGVALTRFFIWLEHALNSGEEIDEVTVDERLASFRAASDFYVSDSFATIAGFNGHGAIVHYRAQRPTAYVLKPEGLLLLDSGAQYHDGTTDITRTISLDGKPTDEQKRDYTRVLKGHIQLATAIYPRGTRGSQLDILARKALWDHCQNYGHGTGHGIGHFLNVHEGPQNIRMDENPTQLQLGMVTSNEPGIYIPDQYGIRIENLVRTIPYDTTPFGEFYAFETLTLCYLDNTLVDKELLTDDERAWYDAYQKRVYEVLAPELTSEEAAWLKAKTKPL